MKPNKFSPSTFRHWIAQECLMEFPKDSEWRFDSVWMIYDVPSSNFSIRKAYGSSDEKFIMLKCRVKRHQSLESEKPLAKRVLTKAFNFIVRWHLLSMKLYNFLPLKWQNKHDFALVSILLVTLCWVLRLKQQWWCSPNSWIFFVLTCEADKMKHCFLFWHEHNVGANKADFKHLSRMWLETFS